MATCSSAGSTQYHSLLESESQKVTDSSFGGYNCSFVEEPDEGFICLVCARVLREPELTDCCGNHYCHSCLKKWLESSGGGCPLCRERKFVTLRDKKLERAVQNLHVNCKHRLSGCSWTGELRELSIHLKYNCSYILMECPNHCDSLIQRIELRHHLHEQCCLRIVSCDYCKLEGKYEFIVKAHYETCAKAPLHCPNSCTKNPILRECLPAHISVCPMEKIPCPVVGCDAVIVRSELKRHTESEAWSHFMISQNHILTIEKTLKETKFHAEQLAGNVSSLQTDIEVLKAAIRNLQMHQVHQARRSSNDRTTALQQRRTSDPISSNRIQRDNDQIVFNFPPLPLNTQAQHQPSEARTMMELHLATQAENSKEDPFLPVVLKMEKFERLKETDGLWESNPFYTAPFGYKLCLCVYANGCHRGQGTHLSVYVHVMAGEFDDDLSWPINEVITVELQNQLSPRPRKIVDCHLDRSKPLSIRRRVYGEPARNVRAQRGSGTPLFIAHSSLVNVDNRCQYLKNDCLYFTVF